jgi:glycosyltransferase involved in cell wall biosynthesis
LKPAVLQLIDSFHQGGSERQAVQLTRLLHDSTRFQVHLATLNPEGILRTQAESLNLGEIPSYPLNSFYDAKAVLQLRRFVSFLRSANIKILHTHDFYTNIFGMAAGKLARVPVRIASRRETSGMRSGAQKRVQHFAYSLAHHIVANSEAVRCKLIEEGIRANKITVVYNGLDLKRLAPPAGLDRAGLLTLLDLPAETVSTKQRFVTIVANMRHDVKDYPMFLRAARRVHEVVPQATFLLAGEGELMDSFRALADELGIADKSFFLGRCDKIAELLSASEVCVLSSKAEGFSNSILEYMAAARPVVATDVGGAREAIVEGETGYFVPSGDEAMMAERIISLLGDPQWARVMGQAGRRVVEEKFSCAAQLRRTEQLYDTLLHEREPHRFLAGESRHIKEE